MRLTCPNCSAKYEVDDSLIPPEGRDVQCSNCMTTWFQPANRSRLAEEVQTENLIAEPVEDEGEATMEAAEELPEEGPADPVPEAPAERPQRRDLDPAVRDILNEERAREEELRRASGPVEEQAEMALDSAPEPEPAPDPVVEEDEEDDLAALRAATALANEQTQPAGRDLLPDIEEINSTLRATTDRDARDSSASDIDTMDGRPRRRRGFRLGFLLILVLGGAALSAYAFAPEIIAALPQAEPILTSYVSEVDGLRLWLNDVVQSLADQLSANSGG